MSRIKRKYIDSHWLVFVVQGALTLLAGWYIMFSNNQDTTALVSVAGVLLLALGLVEVFNLLHRERAQVTWGFTLCASVVEIAVGLLLIFTSDQNAAWHLVVLAAYTLTRGVCELGIAIKSIDDRTDKFIWGVCGVCGVILSFVIFNSGHLSAGTFIRFFASYLVILGISDLIYGIHNQEQKFEDLEERRQVLAQNLARAQKQVTQGTTTKKSSKKTSKKTTKKSTKKSTK